METEKQTPAAAERWSAVVGWVRSHRQASISIGGVVVVAAALGAWSLWSAQKTELAAAEQLAEARFAFESENLPLAASEFARIMENFAGTRAADEATILLAQVRLRQGQNQQALDVLRKFAPQAREGYQAQAYGLMGATYENLGKPKEAAETYEEAASLAPWPFLAGQFLSDAGRAWVAAGRPDDALRVYRRIVADYAETGPVTEAKVRIGELSAGR